VRKTESMIQVSFKIPKALRDMIEKHVKHDLYVNLSDFFRDALREKIQREAPELYRQVFQDQATVGRKKR